jgi:hypothetical protein
VYFCNLYFEGYYLGKLRIDTHREKYSRYEPPRNELSRDEIFKDDLRRNELSRDEKFEDEIPRDFISLQTENTLGLQ